jgi:hypothetical protein
VHRAATRSSTIATTRTRAAARRTQLVSAADLARRRSQRVGVLQGTYLAITSTRCAASDECKRGESLRCKFCTTGRNVGTQEASAKTIADVVENGWAAKQESGVTFCAPERRYFQGPGGLSAIAPYVKAIKNEVDRWSECSSRPRRVSDGTTMFASLGVDHFSICLELLDPEWFARIFRARRTSTDRSCTLTRWILRHAVAARRRVGRDHRRHRADREHASPRSIASSISARFRPSAFRPTVGADMENWPSPSFEEMRTVMAHVRGLPRELAAKSASP